MLPQPAGRQLLPGVSAWEAETSRHHPVGKAGGLSEHELCPCEQAHLVSELGGGHHSGVSQAGVQSASCVFASWRTRFSGLARMLRRFPRRLMVRPAVHGSRSSQWRPRKRRSEKKKREANTRPAAPSAGIGGEELATAS